MQIFLNDLPETDPYTKLRKKKTPLLLILSVNPILFKHEGNYEGTNMFLNVFPIEFYISNRTSYEA